jgi:cytochrome c-type biogenesis protein CcmE
MSKNTKIIIGIIFIVVGIGVCRFLIGVFMLGSSVSYLNYSIQTSSQDYFLTINEVINEKENMLGKSIRLSGVVIGETIESDEASGQLSFFIADIPGDYDTVEQQGGLAVVLQNAVNDPNRQRIRVVYVGKKPELLRHMAQAIVTGKLHSDGIFYADEILLKCPSRYEEAVPNQAID